MLERIAELLNFAYRQTWALQTAFDALKNSVRPGGRSLFAALLMVVQAFNFVLFSTPLPANGQTLDLTGYSLVFCDDFDGEALNTDVWKYRIEGARRDGFDSRSQVEVKDGNLVITAEYLKDGVYGEGWYTGNVSLREKYCRGYFEIRCKVSDGGDFWSAFWIQGDHPYDHTLSAGGVNSAEIDIFEAMNADEKTPLRRNAVTHTVHCNGFDDDPDKIDSRNLGTFRGKNIYTEYNTYGLEWTEDEYIFYINGVETTRSSFGNGVSTTPEEVIVSLESPASIGKTPGFRTQYVVDYVKIYRK